MKFDASVIILTYFPEKEKLFSTLKSVLMQKNISYEILVADDGSDNFYREEIEEMMNEYNFNNFKFVAHKENKGTVINFYDALKEAEGEIVKPISPGDYFYSEDTLYKVYEFMKEHNADATFGNIVYYSNDEKFKVFDIKTPICDDIYLNYKNYNSQKIAKSLIKYSDFICGASLFYKTSVLTEFLSQVIGTLIYAEDAITQFFAIEGKKILKFDEFVVFYEYASGISAGNNFGSNRIMDDFIRFYKLLSQKYPKNAYLETAKRKFDLIVKNDRIGYYLYRLTLIDNIFRSIKQKIVLKSYKCENFNLNFFEKITERNSA
ncbi:MAG: glycosyltransferase family 2 protein [Clostridia bacterium]|nr:glycosyltransferase family 2 protein [Clostridia bacterium]